MFDETKILSMNLFMIFMKLSCSMKWLQCLPEFSLAWCSSSPGVCKRRAPFSPCPSACLWSGYGPKTGLLGSNCYEIMWKFTTSNYTFVIRRTMPNSCLNLPCQHLQHWKHPRAQRGRRLWNFWTCTAFDVVPLAMRWHFQYLSFARFHDTVNFET